MQQRSAPCHQEHCATQAADGDSGGRGPLDGPCPIASEHTVNEGQGQIPVPLSALQREKIAHAGKGEVAGLRLSVSHIGARSA